MIIPQNSQEPTSDIASQLKRQGLKMNKKTSPGNSATPISNGSSNGGVKIPNDGNPNSRSSYDCF
jgi:hypothetical protein